MAQFKLQLFRIQGMLSAARSWPALVVSRGQAMMLALFLGGFVLFPLRVVGWDFAYLPGDAVDNRLNNFALEHGYQWLIGAQPSFWHATFCYPAQWLIAHSDAHIGNLPLYALARFAGASPEGAFQGWWLATFALNYFSAAWVARRFGLTPIGAAACAFVFTFGLPAAASLPHAQLAPRYFVPLACLFAWRWLERPNWRCLLGTGLALLSQLYCTVYMGYFLLLFVGVMALVRLVIMPRTVLWRDHLRPGWQEFARRLAVVGLCGLAILPLARAHRAASKDTDPTPVETVLLFMPKPADWVRAPESSWLWSSLDGSLGGDTTPGLPFHLFPGGMAFLGLAAGIVYTGYAVALRPSRDNPIARLIVTFTVATLILGVVVLRWQEWNPYRALLDLPMVSGIRATFRIGILLLFPLGMLVGWMIMRVLGTVQVRFGTTAAFWTTVVLLGIVVLDQQVNPLALGGGEHARFPVAEAQARRLSLARAVQESGASTGFYVFPPYTAPGMAPSLDVLALEIDAMWASVMTGIPTVNGYTGHAPRGYFAMTNFSDLFHWMRTRGLLHDAYLGGFVFFGTPTGHEERTAELEWRMRYTTVTLVSLKDPAPISR